MLATLWFIFLVFLPTQLGKHWWPAWSLVSGVRVDYLSPTLYLTDIILVPFIGLTFWENRKIIRDSLKRTFSFNILLFIVYCLLFIVSSPRPFLSLYALARFVQIPLVVWVTRRVQRNLGIERFWKLTVLGLSIGILWTVLLSAVQMIAGKTVGFWILGERSFTVATPGIATISVFGRTVLRPYATFPHPNALAGFLAFCFLFLKHRYLRQGLFIRITRSLTGVGVFLSVSRLAITSLAISSVVPLAFSHAPALVVFSPQSTEERLILTRATFAMIHDHPLFGVGPGQFLVKLPEYLPRGVWLLQPVHNVPLLLLSEFGMVGISLLLWIGWKLIRLTLNNSRLSIFQAPGTRYQILLFLLLTSLGDHYWMTVQQNRILLGIVLALFSIDRRRG